jgi:hypothetical protein
MSRPRLEYKSKASPTESPSSVILFRETVAVSSKKNIEIISAVYSVYEMQGIFNSKASGTYCRAYVATI